MKAALDSTPNLTHSIIMLQETNQDNRMRYGPENQTQTDISIDLARNRQTNNREESKQDPVHNNDDTDQRQIPSEDPEGDDDHTNNHEEHRVYTEFETFILDLSRKIHSIEAPEVKFYFAKAGGFITAMILASVLGLLMVSKLISIQVIVITAFCYFLYLIFINLIWVTRLFQDSVVENEDGLKVYDTIAGAFSLLMISCNVTDYVLICIPLFTVLFVCLSCLKKQSRNKIEGLWYRHCYASQALLLALKLKGQLYMRWSVVFTPSWVFLGVNLIFNIVNFVRISRKINNSQANQNIKVIGLMWSFANILQTTVIILNLSGLYQSLASNDLRLLKCAIVAGLTLNIVLLRLMIFGRRHLENFITIFNIADNRLSMTETEEETSPKQTKEIIFEVENINMDFAIISSTYFVPLQKSLPLTVDENNKVSYDNSGANCNMSLQSTVDGYSFQVNKEENLCYICCKNSPDAIMMNCGHGGICYDCATMTVKQKDECTQCRNKIEAIYRVDLISKTLNTIRGIELSKVVTKYL